MSQKNNSQNNPSQGGRGRGGRGGGGSRDERGGRGGRGGGRGGRGGHRDASEPIYDPPTTTTTNTTSTPAPAPTPTPAPTPAAVTSAPASAWGKPFALQQVMQPQAQPQMQPKATAPPPGFGPIKTAAPAQPSTTTTTTTTTTTSSAIGGDKQSKRAPRVNDIDVQGLAAKKSGSGGVPVKLVVNQFPLTFKNQKLFQYAVDFNPPVDNRSTKYDILTSFNEQIGLFQYDGVGVLYSTKSNSTTVYKQTNGQEVHVQYVKELTKNDAASTHFYNILFKRFMRDMGYSIIGRQYFSSAKIHRVEKHALEIWSGFFTSINSVQHGTALLADVAHKVVRTQSILQYINEKVKINYPHPVIENSLVGSIVITKYNNKTYRITGISWNKSPNDKFESSNGLVSFIDYYKKNYPNHKITDTRQPLLISDVKRRGVIEKIFLIPELSFLTGMSDEITSNKHIMMDLSKQTNIDPGNRLTELNNFVNTLRTQPKVKDTIDKWGFSIGDPLRVDGTKLSDPRILQSLEQLKGRKWLLIATEYDNDVAQEFSQKLCTLSGLARPTIIQPGGRDGKAYVQAIKSNIGHFEFFFCIIPFGKSEVYSAIKKSTLTQLKVITQCAFPKTLGIPGNAVAKKILHQLIAKLGRSPWNIQNPTYRMPKDTMIVGIDVGHNSDQRGKSVVGFCASINADYSLYHTTAIVQSTPGKEIVESLKPSMKGALMAYHKKNGKLPEIVIVYRDGVGDGMLDLVKKYEISAIKDAFNDIPSILGVHPKLIYTVVKKNTNTRFFDASKGFDNPAAGTLIEKDCTHANWYDFYLVSQKTFKGSVNPTHYHVIHDESEIPAPTFHLFTYHMCYMYYNFDQSVRVPAPCQYAHKLAFLIGRTVHAQVAEELSLNLYFL